MRQWMVRPELLCGQHLLGEHVEHHMFLGALKKGTNIGGYLANGLVEPSRLKERHDALVEEMYRRGWSHGSPIDEQPEWEGEPGYVSPLDSLLELARRCPDCRARIREKLCHPRRVSQSFVNGFEQCPPAWARFAAGETVPPECHEQEPEDFIRQQIGSAGHRLLHEFLKNGDYSRETLLRDWRPTVERYLGKMRHHQMAQSEIRYGYPSLTNLWKDLGELGLLRRPLLLEKTLSVPFEDGWTLSGVLDAAWQHGAPHDGNGGGLVEVVDWKFTRGVKSEATLKGDLQMRLYAWLVMETYSVDRVLVTQHFVTRRKRVSVMLDRASTEAVVGIRVSRTTQAVDDLRFVQVNDARCYDCPFAKAGRACAGAPQQAERQMAVG